MPNPLFQHVVGRTADRILLTFRLRELVEVRLGESRIGTEEMGQISVATASDHSFQHRRPILGDGEVAISQQCSLQVGKLIDADEGTSTSTFEVIPTL